ncbi:MAG: DUF2270 domain-containing protein [Myxococcota bacterium]
MQLDAGDRTTVLVHYYRAMVGRADTWRVRMDTTTNWAIGATAALISFALGAPEIPHYVVFLASFLTFIFLLLEGRRLTFYHLWQQRVLLLETHFIARAVSVDGADADEIDLPGLQTALEAHLGRTVPTMSLRKAMSRRLRRVYVYLFLSQVFAWVLKLAIHPDAAASPHAWLERAAIGALPGAGVVALVTGTLCVGAILATFGGGPWSKDKTPL